MNTVILMGRLTRDPEVRYSQGENAMAIARYSLAVDRPKTRNNQEPGAVSLTAWHSASPESMRKSISARVCVS